MNKRLPKILSQSECEAMMHAVNNKRDAGALGLMLLAGLRVSEAAHFRIDAIDWQNDTITVLGKGGVEAELPVSSKLRLILENTVKARPPQAVSHPYLLWDIRDPKKGVTRFALFKMVKNIAKRAGINNRPISPHTLRHTFASQVYREFGDLGKVRILLRHAGLNTTTIYAHLSSGDQRKDIEKVHKRKMLVRMWDSLRPRFVPVLFNRTTTIGEVIGRESLITQLRKNATANIHTVLVGERGIGKRTLLSTLKNVHRIETLTPTREQLVLLCQHLTDSGVFDTMPKGRSTNTFVEKLLTVEGILVLDSISDLSTSQVRILRKLATKWCIITALEPHARKKITDIFFGKASILEVGALSRKASKALIEREMEGMVIKEHTSFVNHLINQSGGNPQAIIELVEQTKRTGNQTPEHIGVHKTLSATPWLSAFLMVLFASRYSASALSAPSLKVYFTILVVSIVPFLIYDRIVRMKDK